MLKSTVKAANTAITSSISMNLFMAIALGFSLKYMWMLMNTLQVMVNVGLLSSSLPSNLLLLLQTLVNVSNFNIIPIDGIK